MEPSAREMERRAPGRDAFRPRAAKKDEVRVVSGLYDGRLTGTPLTALIGNLDQPFGVYLKDGRAGPGHAIIRDRLALFRIQDRAEGAFLRRLTAPLVFAGEVCRQWLVHARRLRRGAISRVSRTSPTQRIV
jgi:chorismate synthase